MKQKLLLITAITCLFSSLCFAKNLTLYDQPQANAKSVGTIDSEAGIIPIFTPKDSTWIKVADPRNGNVGWIKSSDLKDTNSKGFSFTQKVVSTGNGPDSYVIQFGTPKMLTPEQSQALVKNIQEQTLNIQKDTQRMMNEMFKNVNQFPVMMPIIVIPAADVPVSKNNMQKVPASE